MPIVRNVRRDVTADTVDAWLEPLRASNLLTEQQMTTLAALPDQRAVRKALRRSGWLTRLQLRQVLKGRARALSVGPYVLLERIGKGGMGTIYKARHRLLDRICAIKLIRPDQRKEPTAADRFLREARASARLNHPHIVAVHDVCLAGQQQYLAMEYVDGIDLQQLLKKTGPLPFAQACDYARQAALALQHAHEHGIVHRDIKPSNLLVTAGPHANSATGAARYLGGTVKLLDLGVARFLREDDSANPALTMDGVLIGTVDYLAPEQAKNARAVDHRSDLYSLGCTLYHLLADRPPFAEGTLLDRMLQHQLDAPAALAQRRPDCPPELTAVVQKLLAKSPEDRYQTAAEVARDLAPFANVEISQPVIVVSPSLSTDLPATTALADTVAHINDDGKTVPESDFEFELPEPVENPIDAVALSPWLFPAACCVVLFLTGLIGNSLFTH